MFTHVLNAMSVSVLLLVLALKPFANVTGGTDRMRLIGVISVDRCMEYPFKFNGVINQLSHSLEEGCQKARLGECTYSVPPLLTIHWTHCVSPSHPFYLDWNSFKIKNMRLCCKFFQFSAQKILKQKEKNMSLSQKFFQFQFSEGPKNLS